MLDAVQQEGASGADPPMVPRPAHAAALREGDNDDGSAATQEALPSAAAGMDPEASPAHVLAAQPGSATTSSSAGGGVHADASADDAGMSE